MQGVAAALQQHYQEILREERLVWLIPADLPAVLADQKALHSVLFHLLDNALKYAPQGEIEITAFAQPESVCVQVRDHGAGIPASAQPFLFERFYRARMTDAQTIYGHGLGLYLVRRFVEAMNGSVSAANHPEGGACFQFTLPRESNEATSNE